MAPPCPLHVVTRWAWAGAAIMVTPPTARTAVADVATTLRNFIRGITFVVIGGRCSRSVSGKSPAKHHSESTPRASICEYSAGEYSLLSKFLAGKRKNNQERNIRRRKAPRSILPVAEGSATGSTKTTSSGRL